MQSNRRCPRVTSRVTLTDNNSSERIERGAVVAQSISGRLRHAE